MKAASRESLSHLEGFVDRELAGSASDSVVDTQAGLELFEVVEVLDSDRTLRVAIASNAAPASVRQDLAKELFSAKLSPKAYSIVSEAVSQTWSRPKDLRYSLVMAGRRALLRGAEVQNQLEQVEDELFRLSRVLDNEGTLSMLLSDRTATAEQKRSLLANVVYGKVTTVTEALALQAIGRPEDNPGDDIAAIVAQAAGLEDKTVARVVSATDLTDSQRATLEDKLDKIFDRRVSIHNEVDSSLLGGMTIHVGNEVIDGSTKGKLERLRSALA